MTEPPTIDAEVAAQLTAEDVELGESAARGHTRIRAHAARLFNDGLAAARNGHPAAARDYFAACVGWYPHDREARSALALACLETGDREAARAHWQLVLAQRPSDRTAQRGLALLDAAASPAPVPPRREPAEAQAEAPERPEPETVTDP